jgi:hypothetical protein
VPLSLGANAEEIRPLGAAPPPPIESRTPEMPRVKSIRFLSASPNGVGSIAAARLPETANGSGPFTVAPASVLKVRLWLPERKLTVSWVPTRLIAPVMFELASRLSVSGPPPNRMAVPPKLLMVPALVRVSVPVIDATVVVPLVNPELIATALPPKNDCTVKPPVLCPELIPVALPPLASTKNPPALLPELVPVAFPLFVTTKNAPALFPELVPVALPLPFACTVIPPVLLPELVPVGLPPPNVSTMSPPLLLPELVPVALPPATVSTTIEPLLLPELVLVALPPAVVSVVLPAVLVPELIVVAFWLVPVAVLLTPVAVPEWVQVLSVGVVVQTNWADAGEPASSTNRIAAVPRAPACRTIAARGERSPDPEDGRNVVRHAADREDLPRAIASTRFAFRSRSDGA